MKKILQVLLFIFTINIVNAQTNFYVGAGIIYQSFDPYTFIDNGSLIKGVNLFDLTLQEPDYELIFGTRVYKNFHLELNCKLKKYYIGYENSLSKFPVAATYSMIKKTIQIPIKAKYQLRINDKFSFFPNIGAVFCHEVNNNSDIEFLYNNYPEYNTVELLVSEGYKNFFLGLVGIDVEYYFLKKHSLILSFNYFKGSKDMISRSLNYYVTGDPKNYSAKIFGKGDYFSFGLSYRFHLMRNE